MSLHKVKAALAALVRPRITENFPILVGILVWLLFVLICSRVQAQEEERDPGLKAGDVFVPMRLRIKNSYSNCVWCAAEDCFWGAGGWEPFEGIKARAVREGWRGAGMGDVMSAANDAGCEVASTRDGDYQVLYDAVANGTGAYIEIPGHAVWLVGIDEDGVRIIDNNGDMKAQRWSAREFKRRWEGHACFPLLNRRRHPKPAPDPKSPVPEPAPQPVPGPAGPAGVPGVAGPPGPVGPPGKDADVSVLMAKIAELQKQVESLKQPTSPAITRVRIVPAKP